MKEIDYSQKLPIPILRIDIGNPQAMVTLESCRRIAIETPVNLLITSRKFNR